VTCDRSNEGGFMTPRSTTLVVILVGAVVALSTTLGMVLARPGLDEASPDLTPIPVNGTQLDEGFTPALSTNEEAAVKDLAVADEAFKKLGKPVPLQLCVVTTDQSLQTKTEALKRFTAAYAEAKDILTTDKLIWKELAKEVGIKGEEGLEMLRKNLQSSYVQTWNKGFIDNELKLNYELAGIHKGVKFIPDKMPEGFFSFSIYNK